MAKHEPETHSGELTSIAQQDCGEEFTENTLLICTTNLRRYEDASDVQTGSWTGSGIAQMHQINKNLSELRPALTRFYFPINLKHPGQR